MRRAGHLTHRSVTEESSKLQGKPGSWNTEARVENDTETRWAAVGVCEGEREKETKLHRRMCKPKGKSFRWAESKPKCTENRNIRGEVGKSSFESCGLESSLVGDTNLMTSDSTCCIKHFQFDFDFTTWWWVHFDLFPLTWTDLVFYTKQKGTECQAHHPACGHLPIFPAPIDATWSLHLRCCLPAFLLHFTMAVK